MSNDGTATEASYTISSPVISNNPDVLVLRDLASTPVEYALWTNEVAAGADVSILTIAASGADSGQNNSFFSSTLSGGYLRKGVPLKMTIGPDGFPYITNGSSLAQISITGAIGSATATANKLRFGPGWIATGVCTWKGYVVVIGCKQLTSSAFSGITRGQCRAWFWNTTDSNFTSSIDIPDNFANGIYSDGTRLVALTNGRNNSSKRWEYNGTDFIKTFETQAIGVSATPIQGSMESYQDGLLLGATYNSAAHLTRFFGKGFHEDGLLSDGTFEASAVGMVKNLYQAQRFAGVSYGSGPTYKIFYEATFTKYYTPADFRTRLYEIAPDATIKRIRVYFSQFGTGASVLLSLMKSYDTIGIGTGNDQLRKTITYAANGTAIAKRGGFYEFDKQIPNVSSFYMNIRFNHAAVTNTAAIIERIEVDWTPNVLHAARSGD